MKTYQEVLNLAARVRAGCTSSGREVIVLADRAEIPFDEAQRIMSMKLPDPGDAKPIRCTKLEETIAKAKLAGAPIHATAPLIAREHKMPTQVVHAKFYEMSLKECQRCLGQSQPKAAKKRLLSEAERRSLRGAAESDAVSLRRLLNNATQSADGTLDFEIDVDDEDSAPLLFRAMDVRIPFRIIRDGVIYQYATGPR